MKAMMLTGIRKMEMRTVPDPALRGPKDVLVRIGTVGVCGSDVHYFVHGRIGSQVVEYPFTVGHECAGTVEKTAPGVTLVRSGDRVAIDPAVSCLECDQCRRGRPHTCRKLRFLGCPGQLSGCLSDYIVMPEECCFPIHAGTSFEQATVSEPFAIGVYAVKLASLESGAAAAVLGCGPIGISVLLAAAAEGASRVHVTDKIDARLDMAKRLGAAWTGNPDRTDVVRNIKEAEPLGVDAVFECCGEQDALDQAVDILAPGGKLMLVGIPAADRVSFVIDRMRRKEIRLQNVRRQAHCTRQALDLVESGRVHAEAMVTHHFDFAHSTDALNLAADYRDGVVKAMIHME